MPRRHGQVWASEGTWLDAELGNKGQGQKVQRGSLGHPSQQPSPPWSCRGQAPGFGVQVKGLSRHSRCSRQAWPGPPAVSAEAQVRCWDTEQLTLPLNAACTSPTCFLPGPGGSHTQPGISWPSLCTNCRPQAQGWAHVVNGGRGEGQTTAAAELCLVPAGDLGPITPPSWACFACETGGCKARLLSMAGPAPGAPPT